MVYRLKAFIIRNIFLCGQQFKYLSTALLVGLIFVSGYILPKNAYAKESNTIYSAHDGVSIITASDTYDGSGQLLLALRINLQPNWHTYWKNPGDAGEPAQLYVQIKGEDIIQKTPIEWPIPQQKLENGVMSYIYENDVILPFYVKVRSQNISPKLDINIRAKWLVCDDICIPQEGMFTLSLPKGKFSASSQRDSILQALANRPHHPTWPVYITPTGMLWLQRTPLDIKDINKAWFIPETPGVIDQAANQPSSIQKNLLTLQLKLTKTFSKGESLAGLLFLQHKQKKVSVFAIQAHVSKLPDAAGQNSLLLLVASAFLAGMILNLMPCVFPIIAMKLLSLSRLQRSPFSNRFKSSISYTLGILVSFFIMACGFVLIRSFGSQLGWGFQFQSLPFLLMTAWLLFVIALNFMGVFDVQITYQLDTTHSSASTYISDFFSGLLAVVVASPCTAPFMGIAIAGALNSSLWASIIIFMALGLGLALPYVVIACNPPLTRFLPRPGMWMVLLKQFLAFPLFLSCVWLSWVVYQHNNPVALLLLWCGFIGWAFVCWLLGIIQALKMKGLYPAFRITAALFALFIGVMLIFTVYLSFDRHPSSSNIQTAENKIAFSKEKLNQLLSHHQPVFVNLTATWCLTCLMNDKIALSSSRVTQLFADKHITYMVGDWTSYDENIGAFLKEHGREGVPFYVYYPSNGNPVVLPQILTPELIKKYLATPSKK